MCHTCSVCRKKKDIHSFDGAARDCGVCTNTTLQRSKCVACGKVKGVEAFSKYMLSNAHKHGRLCVCQMCTDLGMTPKDIESYHCAECGDRGHTKFDAVELFKHKRANRHPVIVCCDCKARKRAIGKKLHQRLAWRCKCPGIHLPENAKCDLVRTRLGEKRWPGKNNNVTEDDFNFFTRMEKHERK